MSLTVLENVEDGSLRRRNEIDEELKKYPLGSLNLPPHLDERRIECGIPKCFFDREMIGQKCLLFTPRAGHDGKFIPGGLIVMPDMTVAAQTRASVSGVLVGAGLEALDYLKAQGIELGDLITYSCHSVMNPLLGNYDVDGTEIRGTVIHVGDVDGSADLAKRREAGKLTLDVRATTVGGQPVAEHFYRQADGKAWAPIRFNEE